MKKDTRYGFRINKRKLEDFKTIAKDNSTNPSEVIDQSIDNYINQNKNHESKRTDVNS